MSARGSRTRSRSIRRATRRVCSGSATGRRRLLARGRGADASRPAAVRGLLRVRGTFAVKNADTRSRWASTRSTTCSASGAEVLTAGDTSCLMHIGGLLSRRGRRSGSCTRRDPGRDRDARVTGSPDAPPRRATRPEPTLRRHAAIPRSRPDGPRERAAAGEPRPRDDHDPDEARSRRRRARRLGGAAPRRGRDQGRGPARSAGAARPARGRRDGGGRHRPLGARRRRGERDRRRRSSATTTRARSSRSSRWRPRRSS